MSKNKKIQILYSPSIDEEERKIFEQIFGKENILLEKEKILGIRGGNYDILIQFLIYTIGDPTIRVLLADSLKFFIKLLFERNRRKIFYREQRPRYTQVVLRKEKSTIVISNVNTKNKVTVEFTKESSEKKIIQDYSDKKLEKFLEEE